MDNILIQYLRDHLMKQAQINEAKLEEHIAPDMERIKQVVQGLINFATAGDRDLFFELLASDLRSPAEQQLILFKVIYALEGYALPLERCAGWLELEFKKAILSQMEIKSYPDGHIEVVEPETVALKFYAGLRDLINKYSMENRSGTPDHVLADYLCGCLEQYNTAVQAREQSK